MKACRDCKHFGCDDHFGEYCDENIISVRYDEIGDRLNGCGNLYVARSENGFCGPDAKCFDPIKYYDLPFGFQTERPILTLLCILGLISIASLFVFG